MRAVLRRHRARLGAELLHRIRERQRQIQVVIRVVVHRAVEDPRDAERQAAGQRIGLTAAAAAHAAAGRIVLRLRHGRGEQRQQVRRVASVERQLEDAFVLHHLADAKRARLDRLRVGGDGDGFLDCAELEDDRDIRIAIHLQDDAGLDRSAESLKRHLETIRPDREVPGRRTGRRSSDTASRLKPVSVCVAVTLAPGSTAPLESLTVPVIWAVACAIAVLRTQKHDDQPAEQRHGVRVSS